MSKIATSPKKSHPYLSQQPPSEILKFEDWDPVKPLLFENLVEGSTMVADIFSSLGSPPPPETILVLLRPWID